jgi:hypothetical protein
MSVLVAQFKKAGDADFIAQLIQMIQGKKGKVDVMTDEEWEKWPQNITCPKKKYKK